MHIIDNNNNEILFNKSEHANEITILEEIEMHFETLVKAHTKNR